MLVFNMSEVDLFNATTSSNNLMEIVDKPIEVTALGTMDGEDTEVGYIVEKYTGKVYGFTSAMGVSAVKKLIPMLEKKPEILDEYKILVTLAKSKNNRDFYKIMLVK